MKIERIQHSLEAATKKISRYAATRRTTHMADLLKDEGRSHHRTPTRDEDQDLEDSDSHPAGDTQTSPRLLDITA
jgi:hypothetical protein